MQCVLVSRICICIKHLHTHTYLCESKQRGAVPVEVGQVCIPRFENQLDKVFDQTALLSHTRAWYGTHTTMNNKHKHE